MGQGPRDCPGGFHGTSTGLLGEPALIQVKIAFVCWGVRCLPSASRSTRQQRSSLFCRSFPWVDDLAQTMQVGNYWWWWSWCSWWGCQCQCQRARDLLPLFLIMMLNMSTSTASTISIPFLVVLCFPGCCPSFPRAQARSDSDALPLLGQSEVLVWAPWGSYALHKGFTAKKN
jgi:hypothetical protein